MSLQPIIKMVDIVKAYHTHEEEIKPILKGIHLDVFPHEVVAIMGASGSGKSTLLNIIGLLDKSTSGQYFLNGEDIAQMPESSYANIRNKTIGFIFQSFFLLPQLTIRENVALPLYYRHMDETKGLKLADDMLAKVGLEDHINKKPNQLSGGQQQRVAIARALVGTPSFVLADEPTGALDSKTGQLIMDLFLELNAKDKVTIVIITHGIEIANQCQRMLRIQDGLIVGDQ